MRRRRIGGTSRFLFLFLLFLLSCAILSACGAPDAETEPESRSVSFIAMDTFMEFTAYKNINNNINHSPDDNINNNLDLGAALDEAKRAVLEIEAEMSATNPESDIYKININNGGEIQSGTAEILKNALKYCELTDGALDLSVYPVVKLWGFTTDEYHVPTKEEIDDLLQFVDYKNINLNNHEIELEPGMEIDAGAVAKGYAGKRAAEILRENGIQSALLNLGGNIQTVGTKPDGSLWRIGVQDPDDPSNYIGVMRVEDKAAVTSGGYQRYFIGPDGVKYWHIIDPETGRPAKKGLLSVTIVGRDGMLCDALSTALFIMGPERAELFWRSHRDLNFDMILITDKGEVISTPGLDFELTDTAEEYKLHILEN